MMCNALVIPAKAGISGRTDADRTAVLNLTGTPACAGVTS
jgi:hypothetical protein